MRDTVRRLGYAMELYVRAEKVRRSLDQALHDSGVGISYTEFRALGSVMTQGPITLKALADHQGHPKTTVHYVMGNLVETGLVARTTVGARSAPGYRITEQGYERWGKAAQVLLQSSLVQAMVEAPIEELERMVTLRRRQWERAGFAHLNAGIAAEASLLAQASIDLLVPEQPRE